MSMCQWHLLGILCNMGVEIVWAEMGVLLYYSCIALCGILVVV